MTLALLGIVILQVWQVRQAAEIYAQNFNASVNDALNQVVEELQQAEVRTKMVRISRALNVAGPPTEVLAIPKGDQQNQPIINLDLSETPRPGTQRVRIRDSLAIVTEQEAILSDADSLLLKGIESVTYRSSDNGDDIMEVSGNPKVVQILNQTLRDITTFEMSIDERIDSLQVDTLLQQALRDQGIDEKVHFLVRTEAQPNDQYVYQSAHTDMPRMLRTPYMIQLFPFLGLANKSYLHIIFPGQNFNLVQEVWVQAGFSLLFSALVLISFFITFRTIVRQKRLSEMKNDFINNMTHELKTPIATISLAADALNNPRIRSNESSIDRYTGIIKEENHRMHRQVERVLQAARFDRKEMKLKTDPVNVHELAEKVAESLSLQVAERNGSIKLDLYAEEFVVPGDSEHLINVLFNLLDNANKYSPENPQIRISTLNWKEYLLLRVADKGLGINRADQSQIFNRFFRVSTGNLHEVKGFGLGLSYVKEIIEAHGGKVEVSSNPGEGSTFEIRLPLTPQNTNES